MTKRLLPALLACCLLVVPSAPTAAEEGEVQPGDLVFWQTDLQKAFARAKEKQQILMICINSKYVDGRNREEPAAKGLREIVYKDVRIVKKSREFVCAFLTSGGNSADYGELRALGIQGLIVSPQHIFVHPDGDKILERLEYWSHGKGDAAVKALLGLMESAQAKLKSNVDTAPAPDGGAPEGPAPDLGAEAPPAAPEGGADEAHKQERAAWIQRMLKQVVEGGPEEKETACTSLVKNDQAGDCIDPLLALLPEHPKDPMVLVPIIRAVGVPKLEKAAEPVAQLLKHKDRLVRGNAAVSLEYIGSQAAVKALKGRATREKDEAIANHMYRALGRCGVGDSGVRGTLLKKAGGAKTEFAALGPLIGLAYFENDKKARRAVEKLLGKMGVPSGGRRGGWRNGLKRAVCGWTLAEIGDEKSAEFVREKFLKQLENAQSRWTGLITRFYEAIAKKCEGDDEAMDTIEGGVRRTMEFMSSEQTLGDEMRQGRDSTEFEPKGEWMSGGGGG